MIYSIYDRPPLGKDLMFALQMMLSVIVATILIANICGVAVSGALAGASLATCAYVIVTNGRSPMFISNSGAFVAPVLMAMAAGGYTAVAIGGLVTFIVYTIFGIVFTRIKVENIYKIFPKSLIGAVTIVIGINLMGFVPTYVQVNGAPSIIGIYVALFTMFVIVVTSYYAKGMWKILPFLVGTLGGYALCVILTLIGVAPLIDFSVFTNMRIFTLPDYACFHWTAIDFNVLPIIVTYIAFTVSAMMECLADHAALSGIVGVDLYKDPGLSRIFIGEGVANLISSVIGGLGACSYGESVGCIGFSKVASTFVTTLAAGMLLVLACLEPVQIFVNSIPSCVFGGASIVLYGFIACSGAKMLQTIDLNEHKNSIIVPTVLTLGISGISVFGLSGTALALIIGVILNFVLKEN